MPKPADYVIVYDVTDDRERRRIAKVLEGFGRRVQYSAFEARLTASSRKTLDRKLGALNLETGWVALYRRASGAARTAIGAVPDDPLGEDRHAFVLTGEEPAPRSRPAERRPMPVPPTQEKALSVPVLTEAEAKSLEERKPAGAAKGPGSPPVPTHPNIS